MSLSKNTLSNIFAGVVPMLVALIVVPVYLRYIGAERYGTLVIIWALLGYFGFLDFGFGRAVTQRMSKLSSQSNLEINKLLWTSILSTFYLGLAGGIALWIFGDLILRHLMTMTPESLIEASAAVIWIAIALPVILPSTVLQGALQARLRFNELNLVQIFGSVLSQILPLLVAANGNVELSFLVPAALAARLLSFFLLFRLCMRYIPISIKPVFDRTHLKPLLKYGGWISIMSLLAPLLVTVDRIVIAAVVGAKAVAHYTIPSDLVLKATIISTSLSTAIFPRLASNDSSQARDMSRRATLLLVAIMTPLVIIGQIVIHPFLIIWLGREFATVSAGVSEIILMGVWVNAIAISHHARLLTADNPKIVVIIYLIEIPIYFLLLWYGVTHLGILGAAIAWSLRVFIDTGILLAVGGAFRETVLAISVSLTMILMSTCVVLATEYTSPFRWVFGFVLILISVVKSKKYFIEILNNFFSKDKSATL